MLRCGDIMTINGKKIGLLLSIITVAIGLRLSGIDQHITADNLEPLLALGKDCPPILYIAILAIAPVIFLPGFPFVIAGGLIYGPVMGVTYAMIGATLGAIISFVVSRYIAGDLVAKKLDSSKWRKLPEMTQSHGWKIVLFLRLIPLFPFTPLNYALGLTNIKTSHYAIATALGIFPACAAFVFFSNSLWTLLAGEMTGLFVVSSLLLLVVLITPFLYKKMTAKRILLSE